MLPILLLTVIAGCDESLKPATAALQQNNPAQALTLLEPLRSQCTQSSSFFELVGVASELAGQKAAAEQSLRTAVQLDPRSSRLATELGATLLRNGKAADASKALDHALSLDPDNIVTLKYAVGAAVESAKWQQAARLFDRMHIESNTELLRNEPILALWLATTWIEIEQSERITAVLDQRRSTMPPALLFSLGTLFAQHAMYSRAIEYLKSVPPESADDALYFNLGLSYSHLGQFEKARTSYFAAIDKHPGHVDAYLHVGLDYAAEGQSRFGLPWIYKAHELAPDRPDLAYAYVEQLTQLGYFKSSEEVIRSLPRAVADDALLLVASGDLKRAQGDAAGAASFYRKALEQKPAFTPALVGLARSESTRNKDPESKALLSKALLNDPHDPAVNGALGLIEAHAGDWASAVKHLEQSWTQSRSDPEIALQLARGYQASGRSADALRVLQSIAPEMTDSSAFHFQLAQVYTALHRVADAQSERKQVSELTTAGPEALHFDEPRTYVP